MKITNKQFEQFLKQGKKENFAKVTLFHGDDSGLARNFAKRLVDILIDGDEMAVDKISALSMIEDPGILYDVALSVGMFSSLKVIVIEDFVNLGQKQRKITDILTEFLDQQDNLQDTYVVIPTVGVENTTSLVKKFDKDSNACSVRCFVDSNFDLKKVIQDFCTEKNKNIDPKALMFLQSSLGNDRMITLQELEKLDLYTLDKSSISIQDCLDCIVSADSVNIFKFCDAIGDGDKNSAQKYLLMLLEEGIDYNAILSAIYRHLKRLLTVKSASENNGTPISAELKNLRPPVFFGKENFIKQAEKQNIKTLESSVFNFAKIQKETRLNPDIAKSIVEEFIFNI